ncbi:MAG: hypothetical protein GQ535_12755 [Rhodobacteraceae bacterium]|nr:hypothetical protein [Paracoccaceae bacterium]
MVSFIFALAGPLALPATAETLSIYRGDIKAAISVPIDDLEFIVIPANFCEISIADPSIADISLQSATSLRVAGIAKGRTSVTIFDCEGGTISIAEILVVTSTATTVEVGPFYLPEMLSSERIPVDNNVATVTLRLPASVSVNVITDLPTVGFEMDDEDIAAAARLGETGFYILGKAVGTTTMYLQHENGVPPTVLHIEVVGNVDYSS